MIYGIEFDNESNETDLYVYYCFVDKSVDAYTQKNWIHHCKKCGRVMFPTKITVAAWNITEEDKLIKMIYREYGLHKRHDEDTIIWAKGWYFSFDGREWFNFYKDYPDNLTKKQKKIFDKENPYLANVDNHTEFDW